MKKISVIIPALNEAQSIAKVIADLPPIVDKIIVCDNGSVDGTPDIARQAGATVVHQPERGYGAACLKAITAVDADTGILLYIDGDYSDYPEEATLILGPIIDGNYDLVIGSRMLTYTDHHALLPAAAFGNWLTSRLIKLIWGVKFTDIGPFRAIRYQSYQDLGMKDRNFGWTVEMQVKAVKAGLRCLEVPVSYRPRIGVSKVSGTIVGSIRAGVKFLWIIAREAIKR
ncbi:MAG: glycosyltransferase [candidate division Zixibacteria bacterium]|nr:glycosyltransferase [candidate division Zixibacteria bacterium]